MAVGHDLDLDMARGGDGLFQQHGVIAKGASGLGLRRGELIGKVALVSDQPHPAPATARGGLDHHRKPDALRLRQQRIRALIPALIARNAGHPGLVHQGLGTGLVAHLPDGLRPRSDKHDARRLAGQRQCRVLGQEPVTGVDRIGPGLRTCAASASASE